ncbi:uncharacterized protein TRIADDRAFT_55535 [Trichoplax adhaerens]|uniref:Uncharacterized protein n=1 Tax=Trichoplax adhaerens TaxID=10228 RepID=B3RV58_TRIAD|nr:hypothetical protein TRIADDRAFT_55535 [Trichoplax adhaerens]EDV25937.1 hypothetical protein TRIADDRAFT_55535 [Trichoplax adhaerens]|eukprot:XP_002111970.1 hypothetical protein TRIADDRAFT_55535 [Trichoplax adhaerens]
MKRAKRKIVDKYSSWRQRRRGVVGESSTVEEDRQIDEENLKAAQLYGTVPMHNPASNKPKRPPLSGLFRKNRIEEEDLETLKKSAESGNIRSQVKFGRLHLSDSFHGASARTGVEWLIKASKAQNLEATELLKQCLEDNLGIDEENRKQVIWCIKTSDKVKKQVSDENLLLLRLQRMRHRRTSSLDDIDKMRDTEFRQEEFIGIPLKDLAQYKKINESKAEKGDDEQDATQQASDNENNSTEPLQQIADGKDVVDADHLSNQDHVGLNKFANEMAIVNGDGVEQSKEKTAISSKQELDHKTHADGQNDQVEAENKPIVQVNSSDSKVEQDQQQHEKMIQSNEKLEVENDKLIQASSSNSEVESNEVVQTNLSRSSVDQSQQSSKIQQNEVVKSNGEPIVENNSANSLHSAAEQNHDQEKAIMKSVNHSTPTKAGRNSKHEESPKMESASKKTASGPKEKKAAQVINSEEIVDSVNHRSSKVSNTPNDDNNSKTANRSKNAKASKQPKKAYKRAGSSAETDL